MTIVSTWHRGSILALIAAFACAAHGAAPGPPADAEQVQGGRDLSARLTVPVTINGGGPYQFVVDTGAERTVISRELAERLTLAPARPVTLLSITGTDKVQTAMVAQLQLTSNSSLSDLEAPMLEETHLGAVGMLGIDSLSTKRVIMDFRTMRMAISDSDAPRPGFAEGEIIVTARRRLGQLILVDADADGQKISVVIDTGSAVSIGNRALRARLERRGKLGAMVPISITSVTGGQTPADYGSVARVRIGGMTLSNMPVAFASPQIFERLGLSKRPALLLGMDVLRMFDRVSIDFANRNVRFLLPGEASRMPPPLMANAPVPHAG